MPEIKADTPISIRFTQEAYQGSVYMLYKVSIYIEWTHFAVMADYTLNSKERPVLQYRDTSKTTTRISDTFYEKRLMEIEPIEAVTFLQKEYQEHATQSRLYGKKNEGE